MGAKESKEAERTRLELTIEELERLERLRLRTLPLDLNRLRTLPLDLNDTDILRRLRKRLDDISPPTLPPVTVQQQIPPVTNDSHIARETDQLTEIEEERIQSMIEAHIQEQGALKVTVVKGMLYGPPRVGKTSLKKRLIEEELTDISPSTGIDRPQTVPIYMYHDTEVTTTMVASDVSKSNEKEWKPLEIKETLETCLNFLTKSSTSSSSSTASDQLKSLEDDTTSESNTTSNTVMNPQSHSQPNGSIETKSSTSLEDDTTPESTTTSNIIMNPQSQSSSDHIEVPPAIIDLIKAGDWSKVNKELEGIEDVTLFQMMDVGGQPEFHDILPLLLTGPALYLLFIRLDQELDEMYTYQYQHEDGSNSTSYTSQLTVFQVLHQILSTIDSSSDDGTSAIIIGTHRDKVTEEKCKEVDSDLKENMRNNAYYRRVKYVGDNVVFPVNNLSGTMKDEIIPLRERIKRILSTEFKGESLPTAYALFYYLLQYQPKLPSWLSSKQYITLNEARDLAKGLNIGNVEDVLKFIHNKFGSVLYYDDVYNEDGEKLVFCDPNVILQAVNKLVAVCFGANPDDRAISDDLRQTGTITREDFNKLCQSFENDSRLKKYVINLLEKRHILSTITVESNEKYFLPCLLDVCEDTQPVPESHKKVAPLLIKICQKDTKYTTIPPGLYPSIIVMLSNASRPSTISKWRLVEEINEKRFKNKVSFFFGDQELVQVDLIAQPQWIEIQTKQMSPVTALMIRDDVIAAIEDIKRSQTLLGQILTTYEREFGFYCYKSKPFCFAKHMPENKTKLCCTGCQDRLHDMEKNQQIWFEDLPSSTSQTATTTDGTQPVTPQLTDEPEMRDLARLLHPVKPQWRAIGGQLGIEAYELDSIGRDQSLSDIDKLIKVFQLWKDKRTTEVSWRKILDVIRNHPIHNEDVCQQLEKFLGIEPTQMSSSMETNQPTGTGKSVSMQSSMTETAQEEEKSQPLRQRKINSQDRPVDDSNMNQSEDVSPSESSKCGTCYKLISYACLMWIIMLACTYLGYTYYYREIDTSNTDSILFTPKQLVAIAIAITALISVLFLHIWNNGITKEKLNEILLKIVYFFAWILFIVIISIITGNTKILEDKWQTG